MLLLTSIFRVSVKWSFSLWIVIPYNHGYAEGKSPVHVPLLYALFYPYYYVFELLIVIIIHN